MKIAFLFLMGCTLAVFAENENSLVKSQLEVPIHVLGLDEDVKENDLKIDDDQAFMLELLQDLKDFRKKETLELERRTNEADLEAIFKPETLLNRDKIYEAKARLKNLYNETHGYEIRLEEIGAFLKKQIGDRRSEDPVVEGFMEGFRNGECLVLEKKLFRNQKDIVTEYDEFLNFLLRIENKYSIENGQWSFEVASDLFKFNSHLIKMGELASEQDRILVEREAREKINPDIYK